MSRPHKTLFFTFFFVVLYLMIFFEFEGMKVEMTIENKTVNSISLNHKTGMKFVVISSNGLVNDDFYLMQECMDKQKEQNSSKTSEPSLFTILKGFKITGIRTATHITTLPFEKTSDVSVYMDKLVECEITDPDTLSAAKQVYKHLN